MLTPVRAPPPSRAAAEPGRAVRTVLLSVAFDPPIPVPSPTPTPYPAVRALSLLTTVCPHPAVLALSLLAIPPVVAVRLVVQLAPNPHGPGASSESVPRGPVS